MSVSSVLSNIFRSQGDDVGRAVARTALKDYAMDGTSKLANNLDNIAGNSRLIQPYADEASKLHSGVSNILGNQSPVTSHGLQETAKPATLADILKPAISDVDDVDLANYRRYGEYPDNDEQFKLDEDIERYIDDVSYKVNDALEKAGYDPYYVNTNTEHSGASSDANYFTIFNDNAEDGENSYTARVANHTNPGYARGTSDAYLNISDYKKASEIGDKLIQAVMDFLDKSGAKTSKRS